MCAKKGGEIKPKDKWASCFLFKGSLTPHLIQFHKYLVSLKCNQSFSAVGGKIYIYVIISHITENSGGCKALPQMIKS